MKTGITTKAALIIMLLMSVFSSASAQDAEVEIDASKPTNFYSLLDNTFEFSSRPNENVLGYRGKMMFAPNESHVILGEVPLMFNSRTEQLGLGDFSARYFYLTYKNYDKLIGAFGPSIDIFAPTGSFENG